MIQYIFNGDEYTTRTRLQVKYDIAHTNLQKLLQTKSIQKIKDGNKFYFFKHEAEMHVEEYLKINKFC